MGVRAKKRSTSGSSAITSNEARLSLDQVASLLPAEDRRALRVEASKKKREQGGDKYAPDVRFSNGGGGGDVYQK